MHGLIRWLAFCQYVESMRLACGQHITSMLQKYCHNFTSMLPTSCQNGATWLLACAKLAHSMCWALQINQPCLAARTEELSVLSSTRFLHTLYFFWLQKSIKVSIIRGIRTRGAKGQLPYQYFWIIQYNSSKDSFLPYQFREFSCLPYQYLRPSYAPCAIIYQVGAMHLLPYFEIRVSTLILKSKFKHPKAHFGAKNMVQFWILGDVGSPLYP